MSLRRKLVLMHASFAAFALVAAAATVYGIQLHVTQAVGSLDRIVDESNLVDRLLVDAHQLHIRLHEIVSGRTEITESYIVRRDGFFTRLAETAHYADQAWQAPDWRHIVQLGPAIERESDRCLELVRAGKSDEAFEVLTGKIEKDLLFALDTRLTNVKRKLDSRRIKAVERVATTNYQLAGLAVLIALTCAGFLIVGSVLVRRWLIQPITELQTATREFAQGRLEHRVAFGTDDEFGALGTALNEMAASLSATQTKYRSLFENLRDAVIILDPAGCVVECRDSDTQVLGVPAGETLGRRLLDIWPQWTSMAFDWTEVLARVAETGHDHRAIDVSLPSGTGESTTVDIIAYPVVYADTRHVAVVLRDVTERVQLHRLGRRSETMEAAVTLAHGIAHDFKNLLNSAVTTLSLITDQSVSARDASRIQTALSACRQAASLSRRMLGFATADSGHPEVIRIGEIVELILGSLDEPFLAPLDLKTDCDKPVAVNMDKDQLTQIILNLIHNAADAMPDGGELNIRVGTTISADPIGSQPPSPHAVITVSDTGCGMSSEAKQRLFEPLFTTKANGPHGRRGMGLAVVYAAVRHADGFIEVDSEEGRGTTIRIHISSVSESDPRHQHAREATQRTNPQLPA